jgi:hypothetical protein
MRRRFGKCAEWEGEVASTVAWAVLLVPLLPVLGLGCLITVHSLDCH